MKVKFPSPSPRLPDYYILGDSMNTPMDTYLRKINEPDLFGMSIPDFQRELVWTPQQEQAFIENWFKGLHIGTFVMGMKNDSSMLLLDGQQRLHTLKRYLTDQFPVFGLLYSELTDEEQRFFARRNLPAQIILHELTEDEYRSLYLTLNFSGTNHRSEDHPDHPEFKGRLP